MKDKLKAKERYQKRFEHIGRKQDRKWARDYFRGIFGAPRARDCNYMLKPNHTARAQSIEDVFAGSLKPRTPKAKRSMTFVGKLGTCRHSLVEWRGYNVVTESGYIRTDWYPFAYPCTVDHGWKNAKVGKRGLVRATGKKGEHQDSLGRTW